MSLQVKPPEKKKRKTKNSQTPPSFTFIPDEITVNCLARIPRSNYPRLSIVSKSFRSLLSSTDLYADRSRIGNTEHCLYVCIQDPSYQYTRWFTLWVNPNQTLPNSSMIKNGQLVPIPFFNFTCVSNSIVSVGSEIYVIGGPAAKAPSSRVRVLDCRSHTWRDAPSMNVARANVYSCVYDGKIYVLGGCKGLEEDEPWAEVFDTKTQTWERLPDPGTEIRKHGIFQIKEVQGKIKFWTLRKMYAYDTKQGQWEHYEEENARFAMSDCVIENVCFTCGYNNIDGPIKCYWSAIKGGYWKEVKGLDSLGVKHMRDDDCSTSSTAKVVRCGGKLLLLWDVRMYPNYYPNDMRRIWCAEIVVEKRNGGEVWGNVEWVDVVHTVPTSCSILHCLDICV